MEPRQLLLIGMVVLAAASRLLPHPPGNFVGRPYDTALLADLPGGVDPCGERGEFHTFCFAGPMFAAPLAVWVGGRVNRDGFRFADVLAEPLPTDSLGSS